MIVATNIVDFITTLYKFSYHQLYIIKKLIKTLSIYYVIKIHLSCLSSYKFIKIYYF